MVKSRIEAAAESNLEFQIFLEAFFSGISDHLYALLWTMQDKKSHWFQNADSAIEFAQQSRQCDLYVGVGLARQDYGPSTRCLASEIAGLVGMWADVDLRSDAHPRQALPTTWTDGLKILPADFPPTVVVSTGNGAHVWWLFREPWTFDSNKERHAAQILSERWQTLLRDNAAVHGWTFDRLSDLARVLRVPGTVNCKDASNPKPVAIVSQSDVRYNPSEFLEYLDELGVPDNAGTHEAACKWADHFSNKPLHIDFSARVPEEQLRAWLQEDQRFRETWDCERSDLKDSSASGYDFALANFAHQRGLTEQQAVNLIVHHRAIHGKRQRTCVDYYARTIGKAFECRRHDHLPSTVFSSRPELQDPQDAPRQDGPPEDPLRAKASICRELSAVLNVEILRILKIPGKEPLYRVETSRGVIEFDSTAKLIRQNHVRDAIAGRASKLIPKFKPREWDMVAQRILDACIEQPVTEELETAGIARIYVQDYLASVGVISAAEVAVQKNERRPIVAGNTIAVSNLDFQAFVNKTTAQNLSVRTIAGMLTSIGAKPFRIRANGLDQDRWALPRDEFKPQDYVMTAEVAGNEQL